MSRKYVVIQESPDTGFIQCVAVCDNAAQAYGEAMFALVDGIEPDEFYLTVPERREGDCGYFMELRRKGEETAFEIATVLFYEEEKKNDD